MHDKLLKVADREIGQGRPCFVIAEAGVNHNGRLDMARCLVDVAADAGADAVKFQTFKADRVVTPDAPKAAYQLKYSAHSESQYEMLRKLELTCDMHRDLIEHCEDRGIVFMSTPFDEQSADYLSDLGVPVFKIPSGEITNLPLLEHLARKNLPLIVSTGMCNLGDVEAAVGTFEAVGNERFVLLHCLSNYPADAAEVNLQAMQTLRHAFQCPVGYSDHTNGVEVVLAAVALGASVIEKHFTLDARLPGPDHQASLEPDQLKAMIRGIRIVQSALGNGRKLPASSERNTADIARRSLVAARDIPAGTVLTDEIIAFRRPGTGLPPSLMEHVAGRTAREHIAAGSLIKLEMVA